MPEIGKVPITTRRTALARIAAAGVATATVPAAAIAGEAADPHPAWYAEWQRVLDWCNGPAPGDRDLADCPEWHRSLELEELIGSTLARTPAGALCQLRMMRQWCTKESLPSDACDSALSNAMATVERLTGQAAHA